MGAALSGGMSQSDTKTTSKSSADNVTNKTYSADQSGLQSSLIQALTSLINPASTAPQIKAAETGSADQINSEYSSMGDRMNRFLAARGFGSSGQSGKAALQTELGRQGALAGNSAAYGSKQLDLMQSGLSNALLAAFNPGGTTSASTGSGSGTSSTSGWNFGATAGAGMNPQGTISAWGG